MANVTDISELTNSPREIKLAGKTLKVRQLKLKEMFGYFEEKMRNKKLKEANEIAESLSGKEKTDFLIEIWKKLPSGEELTDLIISDMCSIDGVADIMYLASKDYSDITIEDIKELIDPTMLNEITPIIKWINGNVEGIKEDSVDEDSKKK